MVETIRKFLGSGLRPFLAYGTLVLTMYELRHLNLLPRFNELFLFLMVAYGVQMLVEIAFGALNTWVRVSEPSAGKPMSEEYLAELRQYLEKQLEQRIALEKGLTETLKTLTENYSALGKDAKGLSADMQALSTDTKALTLACSAQSADLKALTGVLNRVFRTS
jgi:hypothetical protein